MPINDRSLHLMLEYEVGGSQLSYEELYSHPTWPGDYSGITIGIGEDISYLTDQEFTDRWGTLPFMKDLLPLRDIRGEEARRAVLRFNKDVVPWDLAFKNFIDYSLPKAIDTTQKTFHTEDLPSDVQGALVDLVYNRGASLVGNNRKEMNHIQAIIVNYHRHAFTLDYTVEAIARELRAMKRLFQGNAGLVNRREAEAQQVETWKE